MIVILCRRQRTSSEPSISLSPLSRRDLEEQPTFPQRRFHHREASSSIRPHCRCLCLLLNDVFCSSISSRCCIARTSSEFASCVLFNCNWRFAFSSFSYFNCCLIFSTRVQRSPLSN
ncbi:hypothetical protein GLYMA_10G016832v4 [Glycine max]|nr:hypothetical protein GLYMA_10G016832v4 [Glycine max]KAH1136274.1 hypothetical protein GYH30_026664 [Glycine max]